MSAYVLYLIASLLFYIVGVIAIVNSHRPSGASFIALGCTFFAFALNHRKKQK